MQNDISDGVHWLVRQGIADPKRIAIYGASYGGYAGLAFTPDLYACGIDYVGVSNIFTLLETLPPYWELGRRMMYEMVGDPVKDRGRLDLVHVFIIIDTFFGSFFIHRGEIIIRYRIYRIVYWVGPGKRSRLEGM